MAIQQSNNSGLRELALFAGAGGGILGGHLLGWRTVCAVEWDAYAASVLVARQNDECLPPFPVWDDVQTFDGTAWRGRVDVISGGFPCTDISPARSNSKANGKHSGIDGKSSGLWAEMRRIIAEVGPPLVAIENSPMLRTRGLVQVLKDLAALGYDARWGCLGSWAFGADHERDRMWIVAHANGTQLQGGCVSSRVYQKDKDIGSASRRENQSRLERSAYGMAHQMDRLRCIGNGQDAQVAALAWTILSK